MDKVHIIEKLFLHILIYSYLLLPLGYFLFFKELKNKVVIAFYGISFFLLLYFFYSIPRDFLKEYTTFYTTLEYSCYAWLLFTSVKKKTNKSIILILSACFYVFQIAYYIITPIQTIDSISIGVETILLFIYIFLFFYEYMNRSTDVFIYTEYGFWVSIGILIYLGGSFFLNILANHIDEKEMDKYWYLTYIAETIKNILFLIALIIVAKRNNNQSNNNHSNIPFLDITPL